MTTIEQALRSLSIRLRETKWIIQSPEEVAVIAADAIDAALAAHEAPVPYGWVPMYREGEESARIFFKKPTGELGELCRPVYTRGTK